MEANNMRDNMSSSLSSLARRIRTKFRSISVLTYALVCVFGLGSWVAINGIWAELPVLLVTQPECYKLAAALSVIIQVANIGPVVYAITKLVWSACRLKLLYLEVVSVFVIVAIGLAATVLLSLFWKITGQINGETHSVVLIVLTFFLALVDCTSSVVFVPFMKHFPAVYLSALYIGEGMSGVFPSMLALIQGSVNNSVQCVPGTLYYPGVSALGIRYSPSVFFLLLFTMMLFCGLAFTGLLVVPLIKKARGKWSQLHINDPVEEDSMSLDCTCSEDTEPLVEENEEEREVLKSNEEDLREMEVKPELVSGKDLSSFRQFVYIVWYERTPLICIILISFITNGALSSIGPYAFGHYGNTVLHLAINLAIIASPIGALMYAIVSLRLKMLVAIFTAVIAILSLYIMVLSMMDSEHVVPGLAGGIIIIIFNVVISCLASYTKVTISVILHSNRINSDMALFLNGLSTQIGSLLGALTFFCLVYYTSIYQ